MIYVTIQDIEHSDNKPEKLCYHDYDIVSQLTVATILRFEAENNSGIGEPEQVATTFLYDPLLQTATGECAGKQYTITGASEFSYQQGRKAHAEGYDFHQNPFAANPNGAMTISAMNWDRGWGMSERIGFQIDSTDDPKPMTLN